MAAITFHNPKRVVDLVTLSFDFSEDLATGETIDTAVATAIVFIGEDDSPGDVLYQLTNINGAVCSQGMWRGVSGVVYNVLMTVVTNTTRTIEQVVRVAILPDDTHGAGLYIPLYYTSRPYPLYTSDQFMGSTILTAGTLRVAQVYYNLSDQFAGQTLLTVGTLRQIVITYTNPPDEMQGFTILTEGTLRQIVITYTNPPDSFLGSTLLKFGTLTIGRVEYDNPFDAFAGSTILTSGTLG